MIFFSPIGTNTVGNSNDDLHWKCSQCIHSFVLHEETVSSVEKHLQNIGMKSSNDVLGFDGKLLCIASEIIAPILCKFINVSISSNIVLDDWKLSRVTPIYKGKGNMEERGNYRPISVIGHFAIVMEKVIQEQVMDYLVEHKLITADQ